MKFGKTLKRVLHPPWAESYVDYKTLKQLIKRCCTALEERMHRPTAALDTADTTRLYGLHRLAFFLFITEEVVKVSTFYTRQLEAWEAHYQDIVASPITTPSSSPLPSFSRSPPSSLSSSSSAQLAALRALCDQLDKLRSFVLLNHLAFIKILKKYDKHVSSLTHSALSSRSLSGLLGYGPSGETGSASMSCMATIMQSAFYSSPRLAVLLTNVQVQMAMRSTGSAWDAAGGREEKESMMDDDDGSGGLQAMTAAPSSPSATADDYEFTCPICLDTLTLPVILSCSHRFCFSCLAAWSTQSQKCPVCRLEHPLHPDSYTVSSTLDSFLRKSARIQAQKARELARTSSSDRSREATVMQTATGEYDDDEAATPHDGDPPLLQKAARSPQPNPSKGIYAHALQPSTVNSLKHINTLLDVASASSYLIFDVDDTLITNLYTPCLLTTDKGIQAYQAILSRNPLYADLSLKQKNATTRVLQRALDSKRLVESDTHMVVRTLQEMGAVVFGLTKRWSDSAAETRKELLTMGIDFVASSPFPRGRKYCDECTDSLLVDGVIYTNGHEKGPVLDRFLSQILFARHLAGRKEGEGGGGGGGGLDAETKEAAVMKTGGLEGSGSTSPSSRFPLSSFASMLMSSIHKPFARERSASELTKAGAPSPGPSPPPPLVAVPSSLVFVDDLHENASSVFHDLSVCAALAIPIIACHYTAVKDQMEDMLAHYHRRMLKEHSPASSSSSSSSSSAPVPLPPLCVHSDMEVLQYQVYHLVHKQQVINDQQARFIITRLKKKAQGEPGPTSPAHRRIPTAKDRRRSSTDSAESGGSASGGEEERRSMERMTVSGGEAMEVEVTQ